MSVSEALYMGITMTATFYVVFTLPGTVLTASVYYLSLHSNPVREAWC